MNVVMEIDCGLAMFSEKSKQHDYCSVNVFFFILEIGPISAMIIMIISDFIKNLRHKHH